MTGHVSGSRGAPYGAPYEQIRNNLCIEINNKSNGSLLTRATKKNHESILMRVCARVCRERGREGVREKTLPWMTENSLHVFSALIN